MKIRIPEWPFVSRWTYEQVRRENVFLKDALYEAQKELNKHKKLITEIREGSPKTLDAFMENLNAGKTTRTKTSR